MKRLSLIHRRFELLEFLRREAKPLDEAIARRPLRMKTPGGWNGPNRRAPKSKL